MAELADTMSVGEYMFSSGPRDPHRNVDRPGSELRRTGYAVKREVARYLGFVAAHVLTPSGLEHKDVRARLWRGGVAAQASGFYASLVDPSDVGEAPEAQDMPGVNLNPERQLDYVTARFPLYRDEYAALPLERPADWEATPRFFLGNDAFQDVDPLAYWGMIRLHRPATIVEIGSGFSTLLAAQAVRKNGSGRVVAVDPFPREFIRRNDLDIELVSRRVQDVDSELFRSLRTNDIVFVDSSHVVRRGGDVNWFFLNVLPHLAAGVLVHFHDIHFPFDYPFELIDRRNVYWTEQYLLHAYLLRNSVDEVLFATRYAAHHFPEQMAAAFPLAGQIDGASLWMRVG
jgi:hypothetical protein